MKISGSCGHENPTHKMSIMEVGYKGDKKITYYMLCNECFDMLKEDNMAKIKR